MSKETMKEARKKEVVANVVLIEVLRTIVQNVSSVKGGEMIILLLENPYIKFPYFYLEHSKKSKAISNPNYANIHDLQNLENITDYLLKTPIPLCDEQTKKEIYKRLKALNKKIENSRLVEDTIDLYDLEAERTALLSYLAQVLAPSGQLKYFKDNLERTKQAVLQNVRRFLREVSEIDNHLSGIIKGKIEVAKFTMSVKEE